MSVTEALGAPSGGPATERQIAYASDLAAKAEFPSFDSWNGNMYSLKSADRHLADTEFRSWIEAHPRPADSSKLARWEKARTKAREGRLRQFYQRDRSQFMAAKSAKSSTLSKSQVSAQIDILNRHPGWLQSRKPWTR